MCVCQSGECSTVISLSLICLHGGENNIPHLDQDEILILVSPSIHPRLCLSSFLTHALRCARDERNHHGCRRWLRSDAAVFQGTSRLREELREASPPTQLQLRVGLAQAPVHVAVAVGLLKQVVQDLAHVLPLVHHQRLGAAVIQQHLHHQLRCGTKRRILIVRKARRAKSDFLPF